MKQILLIALFTTFMIGGNSFAQTHQGTPKAGGCQGQSVEMHKGGCNAIPNLTEEQMKKMEPLKLDFQKKKFEIRNQINVKEAQLIVVTTGDKINKDEAYKIIDEISVLRATLEKAKFDHKMAVRAILTPEQQFYFDMHGMKGGDNCGDKKGPGKMNGQNCGQGQMQGGNCQGQGKAQGGSSCCPEGGQKPAGGCNGQGTHQGQGTGCSQGK